MGSDKCAVCGVQKSVPCVYCGTVYYCCKNHQKKHWNEHKIKCKPFKMEYSDKLGRHIIAARDLKAGELILREFPLIVGPRVNSKLLCLGCFRVLPKKYKICRNCNLAPVCNKECESKYPHSKYECEYYQNHLKNNVTSNFIVTNFNLVMPLKCLQIMSLVDSGWENFIELESHIEERKNSVIWKFYNENVVQILYSVGVLNENDFVLMQKICGILDVNSFEVRGPESATFPGEPVRGIYHQAAFMSHDCIGNIHLSVDDNFEMAIRTSVPIRAGQPILFNYADPFESTSERLDRLKEGKYFNCECKRCADPTELGTYMGSVKCSKCISGCVISENPLSTTSIWHCEKCNYEFDYTFIKSVLAEGKSLIEKADQSDLVALENFLYKYSKNFPSTSAVLVETKQKLIALLHDRILRELPVNGNVLKKLINLIQELLQLVEVIEPGISRLKGIALYQLHKSQLLLAKKQYNGNEITLREYLMLLQECEKVLKEAVSLLVYEPHNSPEGRLLKTALSDLKLIREDIRYNWTLMDNEPLTREKKFKFRRKTKNS